MGIGVLFGGWLGVIAAIEIVLPDIEQPPSPAVLSNRSVVEHGVQQW